MSPSKNKMFSQSMWKCSHYNTTNFD